MVFTAYQSADIPSSSPGAGCERGGVLGKAPTCSLQALFSWERTALFNLLFPWLKIYTHVFFLRFCTCKKSSRGFVLPVETARGCTEGQAAPLHLNVVCFPVGVCFLPFFLLFKPFSLCRDTGKFGCFELLHGVNAGSCTDTLWGSVTCV